MPVNMPNATSFHHNAAIRSPNAISVKSFCRGDGEEFKVSTVAHEATEDGEDSFSVSMASPGSMMLGKSY